MREAGLNSVGMKGKTYSLLSGCGTFQVGGRDGAGEGGRDGAGEGRQGWRRGGK